MGKTVSSLKLDDEHTTIGGNDSLQEGAKRLLSITGGILIVLNDDNNVQGVIGHKQLIKALSEGVDASSALCHEHMEMDFMLVHLTDQLKSVLEDIKMRSPQAVVAVDENEEFSGYFSPGDYQDAVNLVSNLQDLKL
ncbi:MAG: hypothetical protein CMA10_05680 [Euryarchaeota archaeon]|nr:hypothetical protein [Euryarchaeota archaeon]|tara:strand:+ start:4886 stop:5296 length:411 start_codon:yes stop_codon:yes gene_type:complete